MENQNNKKSSIDTVASTASAVNGAIKTGKALAGVAKGSALGPYGIAASLVWSNRKLIAKILIACTFLILLPVVYIMMLPSLIFGDLNSDIPVINSEIQINENINDISFVVNSVLSEGLEDVLSRIETDFANSDADFKEVINRYEGNLISNVNLFISQYSAYRSDDYANLNISDMESILKDNINKLYSFTKTEETRTRDVLDETTGAVTGTVDEDWIIYTIVYNGEHYFADNVFELSVEQKMLANEYAYNLSTFLGDGMFQYLGDDIISSLGDITFTDSATDVIYFNQLDETYANKPYGTDNIGGYGCGPTSMSIVVSSLTDEIIDPIEMSKWAYENGFWCKGSGSYHSLIPNCATSFGLSVEGATSADAEKIVDALSSGKLVVVLMSKGHFTSSGHFIVLRGVTQDGKILVADPASCLRSQKEWDFEIILNEARKGASAGGPFWIVS